MGPLWESKLRGRAFRMIRRVTLTSAGATVALTGGFSAAAAYSFSGHNTANHVPAPTVPNLATPEQKPPPAPIIDVQVVHRQLTYAPGSYSYAGSVASNVVSTAGGAAPRPPAAAPAAPPPPPPAPVCHSTPSKPC